MKSRIFRFSAIIAMALPVSSPGQAPVVTEFSLSGERANLRWEQGFPPFEIQSSPDLEHWAPVAQLVESALAVPDIDDGARYFRVLGQNPVPGRFVGQLRVAEGEFGKPLARHRLKSLWDFYEPPLGLGEPTHIPRDWFLGLNLRLTYRQGDGLAVFTGKLGDLPGAVVKSTTNNITVSWTFGRGVERRNYVLSMDFPSSYDITIGQRTICLSMPDYSLKCTYVTDQPEQGYVDNKFVIVATRSDETSLYQISDDEVPDWFRRNASFQVNSVHFDCDYILGLPVFQCQTAMIWKTPVLDEWKSTTITGLTTEPLLIADRFAQTYDPGHHNFVETFWIEPALIPGLSDQQRRELLDADILFIVATYPSAFPSTPSTIQLVGSDWSVRDL